MPTSQGVIDAVAERLESAYRRRRPGWTGFCSTPRVWSLAAETLLEAHATDPSLPLDPELYVASQPGHASFPDPWEELARPEAVGRYRAQVRLIVATLREELAGEILRAETMIAQGVSTAWVLTSGNCRVSPLGCFLVARRAGRPALANRFRDQAIAQHRACPLYREASVGLVSDGSYPTLAPASSLTPQTSRSRSRLQIN